MAPLQTRPARAFCSGFITPAANALAELPSNVNAQWRIGNPIHCRETLRPAISYTKLKPRLWGNKQTKLAAPFAVVITTSRPTPPKGAWSGPRFLRMLLKPSAARPAN